MPSDGIGAEAFVVPLAGSSGGSALELGAGAGDLSSGCGSNKATRTMTATTLRSVVRFTVPRLRSTTI